jgi:hypothetical protein
MARERREVWEKRVERWREGGLTAEDFAAEVGCKAGSLRHWKYKLASEKRRQHENAGPKAKPGAKEPPQVAFVELLRQPDAQTSSPDAIEVVLCGATVRVRPGFDETTLMRLCAVLKGR